MEFEHIPVMLNECIEGLKIKSNGKYADGTLGGAGHTIEILKRLDSNGIMIGIDQDEEAITASKERLKDFSNVIYVNNNFKNIKDILKSVGVDKVDGILLDLGVSSHQLDCKERGFSYLYDAPLDMRMNLNGNLKAYDVVNFYSREDLKRVIFEYGEERWASRIAEFIVNEREKKKIETTCELTEIIKNAIPASARRKGPHPAKRTFQAIRIEVNKELEILNDAVKDCIDVLNVGGRICIITFHSLEDRIVKKAFRKAENPCTCPPDFPVCVCHKKPLIKIINKKPIVPSSNEIENNPRSRSAKLRIAERI